MPPSLTAIREGIAENIRNGLPGLFAQVSRVPVASPTTPCAWVIRHETTRETMGTDKIVLIVQVFVGLTNDIVSQDLLDRLVHPSNGTTMIEAIETADGAGGQTTLGGLIDDLVVTDVGHDYVTTLPGLAATKQFLGMDFTVEVYAPGP